MLGRFSPRNRPRAVPLAALPGDLPHVDIATVEDTLGPVHWDVDNCPVAMELNEPAAVECPQEARAAGIVEGPLGRTTEQAHRIPAQLGRAPGPVRGHKALAVIYKQAPAVPRNVAGWTTIVERSDSLDPHGWNWKARFWRCSLLWSRLWFERRCILSWQFPEPLTTRTKTGSTRPYAKRFLRSSEELRVCNALMLTQKSCPA